MSSLVNATASVMWSFGELWMLQGGIIHGGLNINGKGKMIFQIDDSLSAGVFISLTFTQKPAIGNLIKKNNRQK